MMDSSATGRALADDDAANGSQVLPYDMIDWERRLELAREKRAEALRRRASGAGALNEEPSPIPSPAEEIPAASPVDPEAQRAGRGEPSRIGRVLRDGWMIAALASTCIALLAIGVAVGLFLGKPSPSAIAGSETERPSVVVLDDTVRSGAEAVASARDEPAIEIRTDENAAMAVETASANGPGPTDLTAPVLTAPVGADLPSPPPIPSANAASLASSTIEVVLHVPPSVGAAEQGILVDALHAETVTLTGPVTVGFTIGETHLRYYHAVDEPAVMEVAALLDVPIRDFTNYRPSPREGVVEIWMAGQAGRAARSQRSSRGPTTQSRGPSLAEILARIREEND